MKINPYPPEARMIDDLNNMKLFEIDEVRNADGVKKLYIKRIKVDNIGDFRAIKEKIEAGQILIKIGRKREGNVKYAFNTKKLDPNQFKELHVKKIIKNDLNKREEVDVTIADSINNNVADKVVEMDDEQKELLKSIKIALDRFVDSNSSATVEQQELSSTVATDQVTSKKARPTKETKSVLHTHRTSKEVAIEEEEANEKNRMKKRKDQERAKKAFEKTQKINREAIEFDENRRRVIKEDPKNRKD